MVPSLADLVDFGPLLKRLKPFWGILTDRAEIPLRTEAAWRRRHGPKRDRAGNCPVSAFGNHRFPDRASRISTLVGTGASQRFAPRFGSLCIDRREIASSLGFPSSCDFLLIPVSRHLSRPVSISTLEASNEGEKHGTCLAMHQPQNLDSDPETDRDRDKPA